MAIKASCDVITSQIDTPSITQLTPVLPDLLQILADAIRDCDSEIAVRIFGLFEDCTVSSTPFLQSSLRDILSACCAVCVMMLSNYKTIENTNIPDIIRRAACSCLTSQVDKFYHIIFEMVSLFALNDEQNLVTDIIRVIVLHLSDDSNPVYDRRRNNEQDAEDEFGVFCKLSETALDTMASHFSKGSN